MIRLAVACVFMVATGMASASTIYRCVVDGVPVFSSRPCDQDQVDEHVRQQPPERQSTERRPTERPSAPIQSPERQAVQSQASQQGPLTRPQQNAVRSARQYLQFKGFSRRGLIQQLSSDFGDGYSVADATRAVDSLNVNWNEQAVRAARAYLEFQGFSCQGLIRQLSSDAGDKFTESEARYGAQRAGAC